jgi:hypothetical protein
MPDSPVLTTQMDLWSQRGANNIARTLELFPTSGSINLLSGTREYSLTTNFSLFLKLDLSAGVYYYDGTDYSPLKIINMSWLETYVPGWRNSDTGDPRSVYKRGDYLGLYPTPSANKTSGLLVYYYAMPTQMAGDASDPFNSRTDFVDLHEGIILFMIWKAKQSIGEYQQAEGAKGEYFNFLREANSWVNKDEEVVNEIFRPYHLGSPSYLGNVDSWGVE